MADRSGLRELLLDSVESQGYELVHVETVGGSGSLIVRLYIDAPGGITVDDCETVSRTVSAIMDVEDPIAGEYTLEVSSPGLDKPLLTPAHFASVTGQRIKVLMRVHNLGRRRFTGKLVSANESVVLVEVDGEIYELAIDDMESAKLVPVL